MCQYSANDGFANDWHFVHLCSRAVGGSGLVFTEAAAVTPDGRISPEDIGIWDDAHAIPFERIGRFVKGEGSAFGIQLAHAGRKASTKRPWDGGGVVASDEGGWEAVGPTATPFAGNYPVPRMMTRDDIAQVIEAFRRAAYRSRQVGFDVIELHAAHGYLIHEFLSPLSNTRTDEYGGSFENRIRLCLQIVEAVRRCQGIAKTEISGGVTLDRMPELAATGADYVSVGALTHSAPAADLSFEIEPA